MGSGLGKLVKIWDPLFISATVVEDNGQFLYRALARVNAYKWAKFQLPSTISYGDIDGGQK